MHLFSKRKPFPFPVLIANVAETVDLLIGKI